MRKSREIMDQIKALNLANKDDLSKWAELNTELVAQLGRDFEAAKKSLPIPAENDSMAAEIQRLDRQWIKCSDRLPDEHKNEYLCLFEDGHQQVSEWLLDDTEGWVFWYGDPTHWMPLPNPPEESE